MNKQSSKASLFLIELVLSIFFFIIAAVICLQLFVKSYTVSQQTIETNQAVLWSQNLAESFLGGMGEYTTVKELYSDADCVRDLSFSPDSHLLLCFDEDWNSREMLHGSSYIVFSVYRADENYAYQDIYIAKAPDMLLSNMSYSDFTELLCQNEYSIYQLTVKKFLSLSREGGSYS